MTEVDESTLVQAREGISERQLLSTSLGVEKMIKEISGRTWHALERECQRQEMTFDATRVEVVWECRLSLMTGKSPAAEKRREVLKAWSEQPYPKLLAPEQRLGRWWLDENRELLPGLRSISQVVVSPRNADQSLRGYQDLLIIVRPGFRPGDPGLRWNEFYRAVDMITDWGHLSTWTEYLP